MKTFLAILMAVVVSNTAWAGCLDGSPMALARQNHVVDSQHLRRFNNATLAEAKKKGDLLPLATIPYVTLDSELEKDGSPRFPSKFHFVLPRTWTFIRDLSDTFFKTFGRPLQINSGVRSIERQIQLRNKYGNVNAAGIVPGPGASSHLTGATVDIARKKLKSAEERWLGRYFCDLDNKGWIEATKEESAQLVYHVMVYPKRVTDWSKMPKIKEKKKHKASKKKLRRKVRKS